MNTMGKKIVEEAIDEVNASEVDGIQIEKLPNTLLLSSESDVDSLKLVRLLLEIERLIEEASGKSIVVVDETAFEGENSPFLTVGALISHVDRLIGE